MSVRRLVRVVDSAPMLGAETQAVLVGFATSDMEHVDQHFGTANCYTIYRLAGNEATLLYAAQFGAEERDGDEAKLSARTAFLEGCALVYCEAIGGGAIRRLSARGIRPVRVPAGAPIAALIAELQQALNENPKALRKRLPAAMTPRDEAHFDAMDAEGWVE